MKKIACGIVQYNNFELFSKQVFSMQKRILDFDDIDIYIVDNSDDIDTANKIKDMCEKHQIFYEKCGNFHPLAGRNHQMGMNYLYGKISPHYEKILMLDHDIFPINEFYLGDLFDKMLTGVAQCRVLDDVVYPYYAASLIFINTILMGNEIVDFIGENGLDSGGNLYKILKPRLDTEEVGATTYARPCEQEEICFELFKWKSSIWLHYSNGCNWFGHDAELQKKHLEYKGNIVDNPERVLREYFNLEN
jgi:hypothetical protein